MSESHVARTLSNLLLKHDKVLPSSDDDYLAGACFGGLIAQFHPLRDGSDVDDLAISGRASLAEITGDLAKLSGDLSLFVLDLVAESVD